MKKLSYCVKIKAPSKVVWEKMLGEDTYNDWCKAFSNNSQCIGEWKQGEKVKFFDPDMGGTLALLEEVVPYQRIVARHIATLSKDQQEDTTSEVSIKWIGSTETYVFKEEDSETTLNVEVQTHEDFIEMFDKGWPIALNNLKELVEKS